MISIIGSGRVGSSIALRIAEKELDSITLLDVEGDLPRGEALDLLQASPASGYDVEITGTTDYEDIAGSEIVVITAGIARRADMSRLDLLNKNFRIIKSIAEKIAEFAPKSKILMLTNPLDVMTYVALKCSGFKAERVIGMGGVLDSMRFRLFLAQKLDTSVRDINAVVIGAHGDSMIPLVRHSSVSAIPISEVLSEGEIKEVVERTKKGGAEVIALKGSTFYAPSASALVMLESMIKNERRVLPASVYLDGEYGLRDICMGVPIKLGRAGVEEIIELELDDDEKEQFINSAGIIKDATAQIKDLF